MLWLVLAVLVVLAWGGYAAVEIAVWVLILALIIAAALGLAGWGRGRRGA